MKDLDPCNALVSIHDLIIGIELSLYDGNSGYRNDHTVVTAKNPILRRHQYRVLRQSGFLFLGRVKVLECFHNFIDFIIDFVHKILHAYCNCSKACIVFYAFVCFSFFCAFLLLFHYLHDLRLCLVGTSWHRATPSTKRYYPSHTIWNKTNVFTQQCRR